MSRESCGVNWKAWARRARAFLLLPPLLFAAAPMAAPVQEDEVRAVAERAADAHRRGDWEAAIELGYRLHELRPGDPNHLYNLACACVRGGDAEQGLIFLAKIANNGFSLTERFAEDPDLADLRGLPEFKAVVDKVRANRAAELAALRDGFPDLPKYIFVPETYDEAAPAPLLIVLHGKGDRPFPVAKEWRTMAEELGAVIVAPQAPRIFASGFSWLTGDQMDNFADDAEYLLRLTHAFACDSFNIDRDRCVLTGFSEGGAVCRQVGPRPPHLFRGVIPMGCDYLRAYDLPAPFAGDDPPRFYWMAGENDPHVDADQVRRAAEDFTERGFPSRARIYPDAGHYFPFDRDDELRAALAFVLDK